MFLILALTDELQVQVRNCLDKGDELKSLLESRQAFENALEKIQLWLNEAEVSLSGDIKPTNLQLIQEHLNKVMQRIKAF